ncbi:MAG: hypothetical protein EBR45_05840 [Betaproteobacteria bacterium]|nr:hypothetical protein [Betaproteobacteria bacterium]
MPLFAITVFLSAFLLFQVQPIVAKMILPWFGGSSSVWSVCMVFFQVELLLGYAYVHVLHTTLNLRRQLQIHAGLLLISLIALPVAANPEWKGTALAHPSLNVLAVLATAVGAPYLLLSTTGPLMQAWLARAADAGGVQAQPYRLYALSNLASMLALLTYPVLVEPRWAVQLQANFWSLGYAGFVLACLGVVAFTWKVIPGTVEPQSTESAPVAGKAPTWGDCLLWLGLAATASILLLALTRHMTQDVAPVPFLWVLPLGIYLLSFILCFDAPQFYLRPMYLISLPFALIWLDSVVDMVGMSAPILVALLSISLFIFCMVCHGELVRRKPPVQYLTLFYLMISLGGALGGLLVGLVAPAVFNAYFELPIGLFLMSALVVVLLWREYRLPIRMLLVVALIVYGIRLGTISTGYVDGYRVVVRNFYGQLRIDDREDQVLGPVRAMFHGRIIHGEEALAPAFQNQPTSYYCVGSGIERVIRSLPTEPARKVGVIGLGAGTLAAYGRAGDVMRIYEINEQVLDLARTEFNYLKRSQAEIVPVLGDGRLMLEREPPQQFDLLVLDAFSGDSIPTHLVTLEAIEIYLRHLKPGGILAFHTTNTYLDLRPVMAAAAQAFDRSALAFTFLPDAQSPLCRRSEWTVLQPNGSAESSSVSSASAVSSVPDWERLPAKPTFKPWTDSYSNLLGILR